MELKTKIRLGILAICITGITLILGSIMFNSNLKEMRQYRTGVALAGFLFNTHYSMQLGKKIETFYGMDEDLRELVESVEDARAFYILSYDNEVLFATDEAPLSMEVRTLLPGKNIMIGDTLYCCYKIDSSASTVAALDATALRGQMTQHALSLLKIALVGLAVLLVLLAVFSVVWKNSWKVYYLVILGVMLWVILFGAIIDRDGFVEYTSGVGSIGESVSETIRSDIRKLEAAGLTHEELYYVDDYLERYTDMIPDIDGIHMTGFGENITCIYSTQQRFKVLLDYTLQTALVLAFSVMLLAENEIYLQKTRGEVWKKKRS